MRVGSRTIGAYGLLVCAALILSLGLFLRTIGLNSSSLWLDEVHSQKRASQSSWEALHRELRDKNHAPIYSAVLLRLWGKLGDGEFFLRFLTVGFGVLNIGVVARLGREMFDVRVGLLGAFLLATSPMHIYYSRQARMYVPVALFTSLAAYWIFRAVRHRKWQDWGGFVVGSALGLYTHYYSAFTLIVLSALILARARLTRDTRLARYILASGLAIGLLFVPWLPTFWAQLHSDPVSWIPPITWRSVHTTLARFFIQDLVLGKTYPVFASILGFILVAGTVATIRSRQNHRNSLWSYLFVTSAFLGPFLIALAISLFKPFIVGRYFVITNVFASVVLSQCMVELSRHRWGLCLSAVLVTGILFSGYGAGTIQWREDWRRAVRFVTNGTQPGDVLVFGSHLHEAPFNYYYHGAIPRLSLPTDPMCKASSRCRAEVSQAIDTLHPRRLWVVQTERFHGDNQPQDYMSRCFVGRRLRCQEFGGYWDAEVCLYQVGVCE